MAAATKAARPNQDAFDRALKQLDECRQHHTEFVRGVERRYKSYRGIVDTLEDSWRSNAHPPYINHIVETTLASLVTDKFRFRVRPRLTLDTYLHPELADQARMGAEAHQILMDWQLRKDRFSEMQRPYNLQHAIAGLTVAKTYWVQRQERRRRLVVNDQALTGEDGSPLMHPVTGEAITAPQMSETEGTVTVYDGPTTEVRDVRDFMWPENAVSIEKAGYLIDRVWMRPDELAEGFSEGQFGPEAGGWDEKTALSELAASRGFQEEYQSREKTVSNADRTKNLIEVCEVWDRTRHQVITIADRCVLLAFSPRFYFYHEQPPFTVCTTQPDLFRIPGISQVEKVEHLQSLLWTLMNQRIDNLQLINNAIFWFRPDVEDIDEYEFEPGARWPVEDPTQVQMWQPNVIPAEVSLGAESLLKGDMQNLAGGFPFSSGTDSQNVDQKTATGAALVTNIAQRSIDLARLQVDQSMQRIGEQRMVLNGQFIREPTVAPALGTNDEEELHVIFPEILRGDYDFEIEASSDPLMKQEEQASANGLAQVLAGLAPILVPLSQGGLARMINFDAIIEDLLRAYGKDDVQRYFVSAPPPAMPGGGGGAMQPPGTPPAQDGAGPGGQTIGMTSPLATDAATSPSNQTSVAPSTLLQRALALSKGGGRNV